MNPPGIRPSIHRRFRLPVAALLVSCCLGQVRVANAADGYEQFVVIANQEVVGDLVATTTGPTVEIGYQVDNNGRGPKIEERLILDDRGYPLEWRVRGESLFGAEVDESYRWTDGEARWRSQADRGSVAAPEPPMYIGGDDSPWSLGMYARALLADADRRLEVLPSGRMALEVMDTLELGDDDLAVRVFRLSGIDLDPQLLALDASGALFASFGGRGGLIRKGFEADLPRLQELARKLELNRLRAMQSALAHEFERDIRYRNVRIFDPHAGTTGEPVSLRVSDGRIAAIDPDPAAGDPSAEVIVDGEGGTLVPGLYDMHAHNSLESGYFHLAAGVTSTRDMGNDTGLLTELQTVIDSGELAGTRITPAGLIEARSPYSARIGIVAESLDEALEAVRWYADHGYFEIKIYNSMNPDWVAPMIAEANRLGLGASGHVPAFMSPDEAIVAGYDAIAHINQLMLGWLLEPGEDTRTPLRLTAMKRAAGLDLDSPGVQHTIELMREHDTALGTTAVILERLMLSRAGEVNPGDAPYLSHMPIGYQRYRKRTFVPLDEPTDDRAYQEAFEVLLDAVRMLHDNGVDLLIGTDDGTGFTVHRELELYVKAGIPAPDALAIATLGAATYLGQEDELGSLEPGKRADFFLVPGDPAADIRQVRRIRLVSRGGVIYFPAAIHRALGIEPFAPAVNVETPRETRHDL